MVLRVLALVALAVVADGCDAVALLERSPSARAVEVHRALSARGISSARHSDGAGTERVLVPTASVAAAVETLTRWCEAPAAQGPTTTLLGDESDARTRRERAVGERISGALSALPGVIGARVVLTYPDPAPLDIERAPAPRALVVLAVSGSANELSTRARALCAGAVVGMSEGDVTVEARTLAPAPTSLRAVGPFVVSSGSAAPLRVTLGAGLTVIAALSAAQLRSAYRRARRA